MRLKYLFHRKTKATGNPTRTRRPGRGNDPLAQTEDLPEAGAELTEAARGSKAMSFHACTPSGVPWGQDPAAVRTVAAILREFPDGQQTT